MNKEDLQDIKNILKVLDKAEFNKITLMDQMTNSAFVHKFSAAVAKLGKSVEPLKVIEPKDKLKQSKVGSK